MSHHFISYPRLDFKPYAAACWNNCWYTYAAPIPTPSRNITEASHRFIGEQKDIFLHMWNVANSHKFWLYTFSIILQMMKFRILLHTLIFLSDEIETIHGIISLTISKVFWFVSSFEKLLFRSNLFLSSCYVWLCVYVCVCVCVCVLCASV